VLRFYLRATFAVLAAILATVLIARFLIDSPAERVTLLLLRGHVVQHAKNIALIPPAERRAAVLELAVGLGYGVHTEQSTGAREVTAEWRAGALFVVAPVPDTPGQLVFGPLPYRRPSEVLTRVIVALAVASVVAWLGVRPLAIRIRSLEAAAGRICKGDFNVRVESKPGDMLSGIGRSLNQLADRIGQLLTDERDLLRTVAHEVRAPISRMRFRVERIHDRVGSELGKDARGLVSDLQQVDNLFEELLTYVAFDEFDHERPALQTGAIQVAAAVRRLVDEVTATEKSVTVEVRGDDDAIVIANAKLFDRAVTNLLLNALAYGGPRVTVFVRDFTEECVVDVQDSGPGIPELDRPKVIKPFVRLSTKKTRGTGLGLAIVTRIMNLHQGRLHIVDAPGAGASIQLVWKNVRYKPRPESLFARVLRLGGAQGTE
jgi:two-component system, OmpR family, sensor histidine kinase RstB